jgi:hypothetical protein
VFHDLDSTPRLLRCYAGARYFWLLPCLPSRPVAASAGLSTMCLSLWLSSFWRRSTHKVVHFGIPLWIDNVDDPANLAKEAYFKLNMRYWSTLTFLFVSSWKGDSFCFRFFIGIYIYLHLDVVFHILHSFLPRNWQDWLPLKDRISAIADGLVTGSSRPGKFGSV